MAALAWEGLASPAASYEVTETSAPSLPDTSKDNSRLKLRLSLPYSLPMALGGGGHIWPGDLKTPVFPD